jgi:N-acetylmuramoyl-L-alanine amidase
MLLLSAPPKRMLIKLLVALLLLISTSVANQGIDKLTQDLLCLTANVYFEAGSETVKGQEAVAKVTINRSRHKLYRNGICNVVFAKKQFSWVHQQPWSKIEIALNGLAPSNNKLEVLAYHRSMIVAYRVLKIGSSAVSDDTVSYHATYVKPAWVKKYTKTAKIGRHLFYALKK